MRKKISVTSGEEGLSSRLCVANTGIHFTNDQDGPRRKAGVTLSLASLAARRSPLATLLCCAVFFMIAGQHSAARAQDIPPSPIVKTALVVDVDHPEKDGIFWAGVTFTIPEHWHIYWQNPGDSGIPTTLAWTLPAGFSAGEIAWPAPQRLETSGLVSYGYSDRVTLPVPIHAAPDGLHGDLAVTAKWLVCRDICVPESAQLTATLAASTPDAKSVVDAARAAVPTPSTAPASYRIDGDRVILSVRGFGDGAITRAMFFPLDDGLITNTDPQSLAIDGGGVLTLTMQHGNADPLPVWHGVLAVDQGGAPHSYMLTAGHEGGMPPAPSAPAVPPAPPETILLGTALMLAFLGGLLLNIMPCVLPILALKALAIAKKAHVSRGQAAKQGFAYTAGVVVSFLIVAGAMLLLKASGAAIGWGFQLQHAGFVGALAVIMLLVSANLLGMFELPVLFGARATGIDETRVRGSFLTGALAVLVATPCSAPFMATAIGATLALPAGAALLVFAMLGLGMASPFLLISLWPAARRLLPKPGPWMRRFRQLLALPMLATAAWLLWVLLQLTTAAPMEANAQHEPYSATRLQSLREAGTPVLVDATAAWCLTCKVNERVALSAPSMQAFLAAHHVTLLVADWTASDPAITAYLAEFGRSGVPIYVYYPPHAAPVILPQILTPAIVRTAIDPQA